MSVLMPNSVGLFTEYITLAARALALNRSSPRPPTATKALVHPYGSSSASLLALRQTPSFVVERWALPCSLLPHWRELCITQKSCRQQQAIVCIPSREYPWEHRTQRAWMRFRVAKSHSSSTFTPSPALRERGPGGWGQLAHLIAEGGRARDRMDAKRRSRQSIERWVL